jgi:energy-coupling factor transport system permease protein
MSAHTLAFVDNGSIFHRADSLSKLAWVLVVVIATFQFHTSTARGLMLLVLLFIAVFVARIPLRTILRASPLIFGVALLLGLFHVAITKGTIPFAAFGSFTVTREALEDGAGFFFRLAIMVMASFLLIWTTDIRDMMVGLVRLGMPYRFAFAIFMALRFLPIIQNEVDAVRAAHAIRGRATKSQWSHRFRLWQRYMFTVIVNGLRKAENTAVAIESRGFGAYPDRTYVKDFRWSASGIILVLLFAAFGILLLYWERTGRLG